MHVAYSAFTVLPIMHSSTNSKCKSGIQIKEEALRCPKYLVKYNIEITFRRDLSLSVQKLKVWTSSHREAVKCTRMCWVKCSQDMELRVDVCFDEEGYPFPQTVPPNRLYRYRCCVACGTVEESVVTYLSTTSLPINERGWCSCTGDSLRFLQTLPRNRGRPY